MDDFIFKMPKLPEDSAGNKRKGNKFTRQENDNENWGEFRPKGNNSFQSSLFNGRNIFGSHNQLKPLREGIEECLAQPSTSQCSRILQNRNNTVGVSYGSFGRFGNDCINDFGFNAKHSLVNVTVGENQHNSVFNTVNQSRMPYSGMSGKVFGNSSNFSSSHNSHHSSVLNSQFKNSLCDKSDINRRMNSGNFSGQNRFVGGNGIVEPLNSSLSIRKSVFGTETLPKRFGMARDTTMGESRNNFNSEMNPFGCVSGASAIPKDSNILFNTSQSVIENQSIMKSILQMSMVSMKEQIMNKLENLGHTLLRNAPGMEPSFTQTTKDIKNILENSLLVNPVCNTTGMMSFVSYLSGANGPHQSIMHNETNREQSKHIKKPSTILQSILLKRNENPKVELIKSFTINQKKQDEENGENLSFDASSIMENFNYTSRESSGKKELNLRNWYPIFHEKNLFLVGINEENVQIRTGAMKKRINNRKVLLDNGIVCNLIGNPQTGTSLSTNMKNGLPRYWRHNVRNMVENLQKLTQKDKDEIMEGDVSTTTTEFETLVNTTVMTRSATKLLKISKTNNGKFKSEKEKKRENLELVSSFAATVNGKTAEVEKRAKKRKSEQTKNKTEINGKKRCSSPVEKHPVKIQKTETTKSKTVDENGNEDGLTDRVLCTTKSGRIVKRPKEIWLGGSLEENIKPEKSKEKEKKNNGEQPRNAKQATQSVKVGKAKENKENKENKTKVRKEAEDIHKSPIATKAKGKTTKKITSKSKTKKDCSNSDDNPWGNDMDGLDDIIVPNISIHHEEITSDPKKLKLLSMETPPLKNIRSNLTFLKNYTPVQSPDWQLSRHTRSAVKKFEKLRAQAFKTKIPKENGTRKEKSKISVRNNKDVDTVLNWISEREVRSPRKCSNLINYIMPKRNQLDCEEEDSGNEMMDEEEI